MNSSNSFNICPRCGNSNALNAKYCSRCGGQLKVPEEPVVCHKCHTRNTPMANFCRNCGTALKVGSETKICPRCGKEVSGDKAICECGYSFVTYQQTIPSTDRAVDLSAIKEGASQSSQSQAQAKPQKVNKVRVTSGGRAWAIVGLVLVLLFAYYIVAPFIVPNTETKLRPGFLADFDKGFVNVNGASDTALYGYNFVDGLIGMIKDVSAGTSFGKAISSMSAGYMMLLLLTIIFIVTALVHLIVCIIRCFTEKRSNSSNLYFLIMAIISTLIVGLITLFSFVAMPEGFMATVAGWFKVSLGEVAYSFGYAAWAIPLYFWLSYLLSLCAKAKLLREQA